MGPPATATTIVSGSSVRIVQAAEPGVSLSRPSRMGGGSIVAAGPVLIVRIGRAGVRKMSAGPDRP